MKLLIFTFLISFSCLAFSADTCQSLFRSSSIDIKMDEVHFNGVEIYKGYRESFSKLSDLFRKYFDSKDAVEKNFLKQQTEQLISSIQNNIAGVLNQNGIAYEITARFQ